MMTDTTQRSDQPSRQLPPARPRTRPTTALPPARPRARPVPATVEPARSDAETPRDEYAVGYKKPPKHAQFKPGRSGNPRGRSRKAKGVNTIVREQMFELVVVKTPSGPKKMTTAEVLVRRLREKGLNGDLRSIFQLLNLMRQAIPDPVIQDGAETASREELTAADQAMLAQLGMLLGPTSAALDEVAP